MARQILPYAFMEGKIQKKITKRMHVDRSLVSLIISKVTNNKI